MVTTTQCEFDKTSNALDQCTPVMYALILDILMHILHVDIIDICAFRVDI